MGWDETAALLEQHRVLATMPHPVAAQVAAPRQQIIKALLYFTLTRQGIRMG